MKQTSIDDRREKTQPHHFIHIICNYIIVFSLGVLSCAPHQEPRFLLPLLVPLTILHGKDILVTNGKRKWISIIFWFLFNLLLLLFFGQFHQGAVIPSLLEVPSIVSHSNVGMDSRLPPSAIITYHTYMPPTFLLRQGKSNRLFVNDSDDQDCKIQNNKFNGSNVCNNIPLVDLMGADTSTLNATINSLLSCYDEDEEQKKDGYLYLIAPSVSINNLEYLKHEVQWSKLQIATEDLPSWTTGRLGGFIESLSLNIYEIKCDNRGS